MPDPPDTRRYPVLPQTGPDEPDIETDGWKVWRRYCFDGNKEAANKCDELCYPYWLSDEVSATCYRNSLITVN